MRHWSRADARPTASRRRRWLPISLAAVLSVLVVAGITLALRPSGRTTVVEAADSSSTYGFDGAGPPNSSASAVPPGESVAPVAVSGPVPGDFAPDGDVRSGAVTDRGGRAAAPVPGASPPDRASESGAAGGRAAQGSAARSSGADGRSTAVAPPSPSLGSSDPRRKGPTAVSPTDGGESPGTTGSPIEIDFIDQFNGPSPADFLRGVDQRCIDSDLKPRCVDVSFVPDRRESGCRVLDQKPAVALTRVKVGSHLTFEVTCDDGTGDPGSDGQAGIPS